MVKSNYFSPRPLSLVQQAYQMRQAYPAFCCALGKSEAAWRGPLQPTSRSPVYTVVISYKLWDFPRVRIMAPELKINPEHDRLPHVYRDGGLLCLHCDTEWHPDLLIALTVMQWISGWLYFYEVWLITGLWMGEGTHPDAPQHRSS